MTLPKTYGQIAYEAYCIDTGKKSLISGCPLPEWDILKPIVQNAWEAASQAAIQHFLTTALEDIRKEPS